VILRAAISILVPTGIIVTLSIGAAADNTAPITDDALFMTQIPDDNDLRPQILRGTPAKKKDWPATLIFQSRVQKPDLSCTATIVGEQVVITAAHCVKVKERKVILLENTLRDLTCEIHQDYTGANCSHATNKIELVGCTADIAVCHTENNKKIPTTRAERVDIHFPSMAKDAELTLVGYGCVTVGGSVTSNPQVGNAKVTFVPAHDQPPDLSDPLEDFVHTSPDEAVLCNGDSGGGIYDSKTPETRQLKALGARANLSSGSYLVDLSHDRISSFIRKAKSNFDICGIDSDSTICRK
jgi:secreted trypsin-like serine protease